MTNPRRALITGVAGQDGSYLAEFLLDRPEYVVHGLVRPSSTSTSNPTRIAHLFRDERFAHRLFIHVIHLSDASALAALVDEAYGLFACSGILFNHESPRRGEEFVTRKITLAAARIKEGFQRELGLSNLDARRDWGFAGDYARAMRLMLQQDEPRDYIVATGRMHSIRKLLDLAFGMLDLDYRDYVDFDPSLARPSEVDSSCGDPSKARRYLGWEPRIDFSGLVRLMVEHDLEFVRREAHARSLR